MSIRLLPGAIVQPLLLPILSPAFLPRCTSQIMVKTRQKSKTKLKSFAGWKMFAPLFPNFGDVIAKYTIRSMASIHVIKYHLAGCLEPHVLIKLHYLLRDSGVRRKNVCSMVPSWMYLQRAKHVELELELAIRLGSTTGDFQENWLLALAERQDKYLLTSCIFYMMRHQIVLQLLFYDIEKLYFGGGLLLYNVLCIHLKVQVLINQAIGRTIS